MRRSTPFHRSLPRVSAWVLTRALIALVFVAAGLPGAMAATSLDEGGLEEDTRILTTTMVQPLQWSFPVGGSVQVYAGVGVAELNGIPTGTFTFDSCAPDDQEGTACTAWSAFDTQPLNGDAEAFSTAYTPSSGGKWCFRAAYSGDAVYAPSVSAPACSDVTRIPSATALGAAETVVDAGTPVYATAQVTGTSGAVPTGTMAFAVCPVADAADPTCQADWSLHGSSPIEATGAATSPAFYPTEGAWCWLATYSGDRTYLPSEDAGACFQAAAVEPPAEDPVDDGTIGNGTVDDGADNGTADDGTDNGTTDNGTTDNGTHPDPPAWLGLGAWKHQEAWPFETLVLGGRSMDEAGLRALLEGPIRGDASKQLARHLLVARLNEATGALGAEAEAALVEAEALLATLGGPDGGASMAKGTGAQVGRSIALIEGAAAKGG